MGQTVFRFLLPTQKSMYYPEDRRSVCPLCFHSPGFLSFTPSLTFFLQTKEELRTVFQSELRLIYATFVYQGE